MAETKAKKRAVKIESQAYLQFCGREVSIQDVQAAVIADYKSVKDADDAPKKVCIYLKPEDGTAYYVINDDYAGSVSLFAE